MTTMQAGLVPIDLEAVAVDAAAPPPGRAPSVGDRLLATIRASPVSRLALGWIVLLAALAVAAPLLANTNPWVMKADGHWSSPLLASLDWVDWALLVAVAAAVGCWRLRVSAPAVRLAVAAAMVAGSAVVLRMGVADRANVDYARFRVLAAAGRVQVRLLPPIPYSSSDRLIDQRGMSDLPPSRGHWMGTELDQADVASRLLHSCRTAMSIGLVSTAIAITIGIAVGGLMGYFAGLADLLGMRLIEVFEAIPTLVLMVTLVAFFPGENYRLPMLMAVIGGTGWTGYARFLRAEMLRLRQMDFVHAAVAAGLPTRRIVFGHLLPNGISPLLVAASFGVAGAIVAESTLSFLHLGTIDQPSWGGLLTQSLGEGGEFHWWLAVFPGVAIFLTVLSYNRLGEALADALDPKRT